MAGSARTAAERPLGRSRVARTVLKWLHLVAKYSQVSMRSVEVDDGPGAIFLDDQERLLAVWAIEVIDGRIAGIRAIVNPDKLAHLGPVGDARSVLRGHR